MRRPSNAAGPIRAARPRLSGDPAARLGALRRLVPVLAVLSLVVPGHASSQERLAEVALFAPEVLKSAISRAERHAWARAARGRVVKDADAWLAHRRPLPEGRPGFYHDYFCPDHGVHLRYSPDRPAEHRCPKDGRRLRGEKLDAYWVHLTLRSRLASARSCGLAWRFTGDERYARAARDILVEHARFYVKHIADRTPRRWMAQPLDEAVYVLDAAKAYDLIANGFAELTDDQKRLIVRAYLLPGARYLLGERRRVHNIDCWHNAAMAAVAAIADEPELMAQALGTAPDVKWGLRDQLRAGVSREGFWREGSFGYHFYTLAAVVETLGPGLRSGANLERELEIVRSMFLAPLAMADARGLVPPNNDSLPRSLFHHTTLYERGAGLFPESTELPSFLTRAYRGKNRVSQEALLFGPESLPESTATAPTTSRSFPDSGFAVLRARPGAGSDDDELFVMLDFGPHGGFHGHFDKLSVVLHGLGRVLSPDLGTSGYGLPITSGWYRQTLSHNTVTVDRCSQQAAAGKLIAFRGEGPLRHAIASTTDAYPGVTWTRGVYLSDEGFVVVLDRLRPSGANGEIDRTFDWCWHGFGTLGLAFPPLAAVADSAAFGEKDGYQMARRVRKGTTSGPVRARWKIASDSPTQPPDARPETSGQLRLWLAGAPHTDVFTADVPGNPIRNRLTQIVVRRKGRRADFAAVFEPVVEAASPAVRSVRAVAGGIEIRTARGNRTITLPEAKK